VALLKGAQSGEFDLVIVSYAIGELQERGDHRLVGGRQRPAARSNGRRPACRRLQGGRKPRAGRRVVRFLAEEGWLAHWLNFAGDRYLPPMRKLVEQPFWLDASDPHRMRSAIQILTRSHLPLYMGVQDYERQSGPIWRNVWGGAVQRVVADGISPEQAVDEANRPDQADPERVVSLGTHQIGCASAGSSEVSSSG
jgi:hypothetical protein